MKFNSRFWGVAILALLIVITLLPAEAQQGKTKHYEFPDSEVTFRYPARWRVEEETNNMVTFTDDGVSMTVYDPLYVSKGLDGDTVEDVLAAMLDMEVDADMIMAEEVDGRTISTYEDGDSVVVVVQFADDSMVIAVVATEDDSEDIVAYFTETLKSPSDEKMGMVEKGSAEPCLVSGAEAALRVGPGFNRGVFGSMPSGEYPVVGWATASDDSLWWKLDKDAVVPGAAAAEAWVLQDDVTSAGGCDAVPDAFAPPVIPSTNQQAPPPANNDTSTTDTGGGSTDTSTDTAPSTSGGTKVTSGTWNWVSSGVAVITCGNRQGSVNLGFGSGTTYVEVVSDTVMVIDGIRLTLSGGTFYGTYYLPVDGVSRPFNMAAQISTPTYITGSLGATVEGCTIIQSFGLTK